MSSLSALNTLQSQIASVPEYASPSSTIKSQDTDVVPSSLDLILRTMLEQQAKQAKQHDEMRKEQEKQNGDFAKLVALMQTKLSPGGEGMAAAGDDACDSASRVASNNNNNTEEGCADEGTDVCTKVALGGGSAVTIRTTVQPLVAHRACTNCHELLCCCESNRYPKCIDTCTGCTPDASCHNYPEDVFRHLKREKQARDNNIARGLEGVRDNILSGKLSGLDFPPSHEAYCTNPPHQPTGPGCSKEPQEPLVGEKTIHIRGAPLAPSETEAVSGDTSLFQFFRAHPELVYGARDGVVGKTAGFHTRLSPEDTEILFKSAKEHALHSFNTRPEFAKTNHPAQNLWDTRDAHIVMREINLVGHSKLPGAWSMRLETAMPRAPEEAFKQYFELQEAKTISGVGTNHNMTVQRVPKDGDPTKMVDVTTTQALRHEDIQLSAHITTANKPITEFAFETLLNQQTPKVVKCDADGFYAWCNKDNTRFRSSQYMSGPDVSAESVVNGVDGVKGNVKSVVDALESNMSAMTLSSSSSSSSSSSTSHAFKQSPSSTSSSSTNSSAQKMTAATNLGGGVIVSSSARNVKLAMRMGNNKLDHIVTAAYISDFDTPISRPQSIFESYVSNCSVLNMTKWLGLDYGSLTRQLCEDLEKTGIELDMDTPHTCSKIEIARADRKCMSENSQLQVIHASTALAKFVTDTLMPFLHKNNMSRESPQNADELKSQLTLMDDLRGLIDVAIEATVKKLRELGVGSAALASVSADSLVAVEGKMVATATDGASASAVVAAAADAALTDSAMKSLRKAICAALGNVSRPYKKTSSDVIRYKTFVSNVEKLKKDINNVGDMGALRVMLLESRKCCRAEHLRLLGELFHIGCAHAWIEPQSGKLEMFIDYSAFIRFCVGMVCGIRWWTSCADLRPGMRVCFEWAENGVDLGDRLDEIEQEVALLVYGMNRQIKQASSLPMPAELGMVAIRSAEETTREHHNFDEFAGAFDIARILADPLSADYIFVRQAIKMLSPEKAAWFDVSSIATSWSVLYTPIWKHIIMNQTQDVVSDSPSTTSSSGCAGTAAISDADKCLLNEFSPQEIDLARTSSGLAWTCCDEATRRNITRAQKEYMSTAATRADS